jgi:hypothetical protein
MTTKTKKSVVIRENAKKDHSPKWDNCDEMTTHEYRLHWHYAMQYYNINFSTKDLKPAVLKWMNINGYETALITQYKNTADWRTSTTMGSIASCLLRGMPSAREDFNNGRDAAEWLSASIETVISNEAADYVEEVETESKPKSSVNVQERIRENAISMTDEIDDLIQSWAKKPDEFNPKAKNITSMLKGLGATAQHARVIKTLYQSQYDELKELASGDADEQLRESYSHRTKKQIRSLIAFYAEIEASCDMIIAEGKSNAKPRAKKSVSNESLIKKLKYLKTYETLKLVSVNPLKIMESTVIWIYNTRLRKLGKYVANDNQKLSVKGTTIINFDPDKSVQKTLTKPITTFDAIKDLPKGKMSVYLDNLITVETKLNGRINDDTILFRAY